MSQGAGLWCWWETDLTKRSAPSTGMSRSLGLAEPLCVLCVCVWGERTRGEGGRRVTEGSKCVIIENRSILLPLRFPATSSKRFLSHLPLITSREGLCTCGKEGGGGGWGVLWFLWSYMIYQNYEMKKKKKKLSSISSLITTLTPFNQSDSKFFKAAMGCKNLPTLL